MPFYFVGTRWQHDLDTSGYALFIFIVHKDMVLIYGNIIGQAGQIYYKN